MAGSYEGGIQREIKYKHLGTIKFAKFGDQMQFQCGFLFRL
jgi:hypothetical protein